MAWRQRYVEKHQAQVLTCGPPNMPARNRSIVRNLYSHFRKRKYSGFHEGRKYWLEFEASGMSLRPPCVQADMKAIVVQKCTELNSTLYF